MRVVRRGLVVAFLGPDGSGKSAVAEAVAQRLASDFADTVRLHLRPRFALPPRADPPALSPHAEPPRNALMSTMKVLYFALDYNLGHRLRVRPRVRAGTLVIFDRYCHDMLVDPRRYRYGGPQWLLRCLAAVVPKPDLWLLLDAPTEVLRQRKQEVARTELVRLRVAYRELLQCLPSGVVIDAGQPLDAVVDTAVACIRDARVNGE